MTIRRDIDLNEIDIKITAITNRHIGRLLTMLEQVQSPKIITNAVRKQIWFLADDIKTELGIGIK